MDKTTTPRKKFPLSFAQEQLWFQLQLSSSPLIFNYSSIINFPADLDTEAIENGVNFLFERHEALRLTIHERNGQPFQIVQDYSKFQIPINDLTSEPIAVVKSALKANLMIPFDLEKGPLLKFYIIKTNETTLLQGVAHHLILDGTGTQILEAEGKMIIQYFAQGHSHQDISKHFPPLNYTYTEFVFSQRTENIKSRTWAESSTFWEKYLNGIIPLNLGKDGVRSPSVGLDAERIEFNWSNHLSQSIRSFAETNKISPFTILTSGLAIVLGRHSAGQTDVGILIGKHGRSSPKLNNMIGHFSNVLPLRIDLSLKGNFIGLVNQVKEDMKSIMIHQDYPMQLILKDLETKTGQKCDQHLFFPVTLVMTPACSNDATNYLELDTLKLSQEIIIHVQGGKMGYVKYNPLIHSRQRIQGMLNNWKTLLGNALASPENKNFNEFEILNLDEVAGLKEFGTGKKVYVPEMELTVIDLFEKQVKKTPEGIAIYDNTGEELTYSSLRSESRALANALESTHLKKGDKFIAVLMEQSPLFIKTTLAILMTGRTIAVLSTHSSHAALKQMLTDVGSPLLISGKDVLQRSGFTSYYRSLTIDANTMSNGEEPKSEHAHNGSLNGNGSHYEGDGDAYCIFTSGTTGIRKGIILRHSSIIHSCCWSMHEKKYTTKDRILGFNDVSSDTSLYDIWSTLLSGATLCIPSQSLRYDIEGIWEWIVINKVTIVLFQSALANKMLANAQVLDLVRQSKVRMLTCGGDRLNSSLTSTLPFDLYNEYGLTETTVSATSTIMNKRQDRNILHSVGRPIWNTKILLLDPHLNLVPIGVHGKIHVSGPGIGKYWNQEELNKSKFKELRKSYCAEVAFDTGDMGYWDYQGNLCIVGRMDSQIKFRSYRIELKEIEGILSLYPNIQHAVVQVSTLCKEEELIAYCKLNTLDLPSFGDLNQYLKNRLPYYSIPSKIYILPTTKDFPLTANGKIDFEELNEESTRKTLSLLSPTFVSPASQVELKIRDIWAEVLGIPSNQIGIHDHFFAVGGHSLLIMKLLRRLHDAFPHVKIHAEAMFRQPTIHELAKLLKPISNLENGNGSKNEHEEKYVDFEKEIRSADFEIQGLSISTSPNILLTGATGFLGSCLLVELLKKRKNSEIYCLARGETATEAEARLARAISPYDLPKESLSRIHVLWGDMSYENFGLKDSEYKKLTQEIGSVYHSADHVNLLQPYYLLSQINVGGMKQILKFSTTCTLKILHYVSSLQVYYDHPSYYEKFGPIIHESPISSVKIDPEEYPTGYSQGYSQCKWVAEQIICRAIERGHPAIIYRPGEITAHSKLNVTNPLDLVYMSLKNCLNIGKIPNILSTRFPSGSLDFTAKAIVEISMRKVCVGQTFNVFSNEILIQNVYDIISARPSLVPRPVTIVSVDEWEQNFCEYISQFPESGEERKQMERYLFFWFQFKRNFSNRFLHKLKVSNDKTKLVLGDLDSFGGTTMDEDILRAIEITSKTY